MLGGDCTTVDLQQVALDPCNIARLRLKVTCHIAENGLVSDGCHAQAYYICNTLGRPGMAVVCSSELQRVGPATAERSSTLHTHTIGQGR